MSEWISVEDALPNDRKEVLAFTKVGIVVAYFDKTFMMPQIRWYRGQEVTHWMELPEPPNQKGENNE